MMTVMFILLWLICYAISILFFIEICTIYSDFDLWDFFVFSFFSLLGPLSVAMSAYFYFEEIEVHKKNLLKKKR